MNLIRSGEAAVRVLRLVAVNESGSHLLLRAEGDGTEFVLPLDARLRAAVTGDKERLGQLEVHLDSQLRPREIQARIRSGESVESVAHSASVPLDRVMRYASPVLAERAHIANLARRSAFRRAGTQGPAPLLDDAVTDQLRQQEVAEDDILWDAYRRDDGRWIVRAGWPDGAETRTAEWTFDPAGRSVLPASDEARWLAGERPPAPPPPPPPVGVARLTVVSNSAQPVRPKPRAVDNHKSVESDDYDTDELPRVDDVDEETSAGAAKSVAMRTDDGDTRLRLSDIATRIEIDDDESADLDDRPEPRDRAAANGHGRSRRPSVPSWDEIMFGSRQHKD